MLRPRAVTRANEALSGGTSTAPSLAYQGSHNEVNAATAYDLRRAEIASANCVVRVHFFDAATE
jgi:hypothetical protein